MIGAATIAKEFDKLVAVTPAVIEAPPPGYENVFFPNWHNKPAEVTAVLSLNEVSVLTEGNVSMIIALPGMGKSAICEAVVSSFVNPHCDSLGFNVGSDCKGLLFIDMERTQQDVWQSFYRICRRANVTEGRELKNVVVAGLRHIPRLKQRLQAIEYLLKSNPCSLLLVDGLGDLITDTNDLLQAIECRIWLRETTSKYKVSILTTIHPNPNSNKPRGHIGSEGHRESECVLLAKLGENDTRIITTDFEHGKNRNNGHVTAGYRWSDEYKMFVSEEADLNHQGSKRGSNDKSKLRAELLTRKVLSPPLSKTYSELEKLIMSEEECDESTAKRRYREMKKHELIKKCEDGLYRANI